MNKKLQKAINSGELAGQRYYLNLSSRFQGNSGGTKFGHNTGNSLEYLDHRQYQPGDDIRHIDWNAMARSDKVTVKLYREEITPHLDLLIDLSSSMGLENSSKGEALWEMTSLLKTASMNGSYTTSSWILKDRCQKVLPPNLPITKWPNSNFDFKGNSGESLVSFPPKLKPKGVRILISDLFWDEEPTRILQTLSEQASTLIIIHLLSRKDIEPDIEGNVRLLDSETGETIEFMASKKIINEYKASLERHIDYWKSCCNKFGAVYSMCLAEDFHETNVPEDLIKLEILAVGT